MKSFLSRLLMLVLVFCATAALLAQGHVVAGVALFLTADALIAGLSPLSPRNAGRLFVNSLGTLATATIVQEALDLVFTERPELNMISLGFTDRNGSPIAAYNQSVITRTLGLPTVQTQNSAASATADVDVSVTLNNFVQLRYDFLATEYSGTNRDLIRERARPMAIAMGNYMIDQVSALWTPANYPARTGADAVANGATATRTVQGAGWDYVTLTTARATLNKAGVPAFNRFFCGNSDVYASMLDDLKIVGYLNNQANAEAIKTGKLPQVAGMGLAEYPALTSNAGNNLVGVAGAKDATVYAHRVPKDPREVIPGLPIPGNIGIVTEPRTGLSVMVVEFVALPSLTVTTSIIWMYGVAKGNINNLQLITSS